MLDDSEVAILGWSEERKQQWRIERLLEMQIRILEKILWRLPPPPTYQPTTDIAVVSLEL